MKMRVKILCFGMAMLGFMACTQIDNQNKSQFSYVEVVGTAEKEVEPDVFYLKLELENEDVNDNISASEQRLLAALQSLNIDVKKDLNVVDMYGRKHWESKKQYQRKRYLLKIHNLDLVNKTCDKLDSLKVDYDWSKVHYSKMNELKKEVQQEAVKKARQKAENLLSGENKQVGELIYLQELETVNGRPYYDYDEQSYKFSDNAVDFKKLKVSYSIVARFSIK